jgi:hypothetical protein
VVDSLAVYNMFALSFAAAFVLYLIGKARRKVAPLDTYTAGQNPADFGVTTEMLHFAYKFYAPFSKMFKNIRLNYKVYYDDIAKNTQVFSEWFSGIFKFSTMGATIWFVGAIVIIIIAGWLG